MYGYFDNDSQTSFSARYLQKTLHFNALDENIEEYGLGFKKAYFLDIPLLKSLIFKTNCFKSPYGDNSFNIDDTTKVYIKGYSDWEVNLGGELSHALTKNVYLSGEFYAGYGESKFSHAKESELVYSGGLGLESKLGKLSAEYIHNPTINRIRYAYKLGNSK